MKNILIDLYKLKHPNTGLGQFSFYFGKEMIKQKYFNYNNVFLLPKNYPPIFKGEKMIRTSNYRRLFSSFNSGFDLWHSTHQDSSFFPAKKTPYLLTVHDLNFLWEKKGLKLNHRIKKIQKRIDLATAVVFLSEFTKNTVLMNMDVPKEKITRVIYNGIPELEQEVPVKPKLIPQKPFVFTIGVVKPSKNILALVEWMKHMPELNLVISGNSFHPYGEKIRKRINELKLEKNIIITNEISENEKIWFYRECLAFVSTSKLEGFGIPAIEAMRMGKPVFLSNMTSFPEVAGKEAYYWESFEPEVMRRTFENGMNQVSNDSKKTTRIYNHALKFSWEKTIEKYISLYKELL